MTIASNISALAGYIRRKSVKGLDLLPTILTALNNAVIAATANTAPYWTGTGEEFQLVDQPSIDGGATLPLLDPADFAFKVLLSTTDVNEDHPLEIGHGELGQRIMLMANFHEDAAEGVQITIRNGEASLYNNGGQELETIVLAQSDSFVIMRWQRHNYRWVVEDYANATFNLIPE